MRAILNSIFGEKPQKNRKSIWDIIMDTDHNKNQRIENITTLKM